MPQNLPTKKSCVVIIIIMIPHSITAPKLDVVCELVHCRKINHPCSELWPYKFQGSPQRMQERRCSTLCKKKNKNFALDWKKWQLQGVQKRKNLLSPKGGHRPSVLPPALHKTQKIKRLSGLIPFKFLSIQGLYWNYTSSNSGLLKGLELKLTPTLCVCVCERDQRWVSG